MEAWLKKPGIGAVNPGMFDGTWRGGAVVEFVSPIDGKVIARAVAARWLREHRSRLRRPREDCQTT